VSRMLWMTEQAAAQGATAGERRHGSSPKGDGPLFPQGAVRSDLTATPRRRGGAISTKHDLTRTTKGESSCPHRLLRKLTRSIQSQRLCRSLRPLGRTAGRGLLWGIASSLGTVIGATWIAPFLLDWVSRR
jgi:hypothetical protein